MAATCNFGNFLSMALRNQFVCGLANDKIKNRLLETSQLTMERATEIALSMEASLKDVNRLQDKTSLNAVSAYSYTKEKNFPGSNNKFKIPGKVQSSNVVPTKSNKTIKWS